MKNAAPFLFFLFWTLFGSAAARAGACWPDPGMWERYPAPVDDFLEGEFSRLRMEAGLFSEKTGQADAELLQHEFTIVPKREQKGSFQFYIWPSTKVKEGSTLMTFAYSPEIDFFAVDIGRQKPNQPPHLYKDMVLKGTLSIQGPLAKLIGANVPAKLIFHGTRGTRCVNVDGIENWKLKFEIRLTRKEAGEEIVRDIAFEGQGETSLTPSASGN